MLTDFNGFRNMEMRSVTLPTVLGGAVAMECDVLDAKPKPEIQWFRNNEPTAIMEERRQYNIMYLKNGRFLFIRQLTALQRMSSYHCEVVNAYLTPTHVRAPTTYLLDGNIASFTLKVYRPEDELNHAIFGEDVTYFYAAAHADQDGITALNIILSCRNNPGIRVFIINDIVIRINGLSGDENTGLATVSCDVLSLQSDMEAELEITFLVGRKKTVLLVHESGSPAPTHCCCVRIYTWRQPVLRG